MALTTNLVSYWKLDESSGNAVDSVGGNTLVNSGVTFSAAKKNNGAVVSSASASNRLEISDASQSGLQFTNQLSFSLWVDITTGSRDNSLVGKYRSDVAQRSYTLRLNSSDQVQFYLSDDGSSSAGHFVGYRTTATVPTSGFHHIVWTVDLDTESFHVYIDGVDCPLTQTNGSTIGASLFDNTAAFDIGNEASADGAADCVIDEVGAWSRVLSQNEASQLWNGGQATQHPFTDIGIAFDKASSITGNATLSHTCSGDNRTLIVLVQKETGYATGVTYNGVPMTELDQVNAYGEYMSSWILVNPDVGTHNVVVSGAGAIDQLFAVSYTGTKQSGQPDNHRVSSPTTQNISESITTVADKCWVWFGLEATQSPTAGSNVVIRSTQYGVTVKKFCGDSNIVATPAGSFTQTLTRTASEQYYFMQISIAPATSAGPANVKTVSGVDKANVKTVSSVSLANIKTVSGLA